MASNQIAGQAPLELDDEKKVVKQVGEQILSALEAVAKSAQEALSSWPSGTSASALVNPSNLMVGDVEPEKRIHAKNAEERTSLARLLHEPFLARVEVDWALRIARPWRPSTFLVGLPLDLV